MDWFFCGKTTSACYQQFLLRKLLLLTSVEVGFTMFATHGLLFHFSTGHVPPNFCPLLQSVRVWLLGSTSPAPSPISIPKHGTRKKWITWQVLFFNSFCFRNICFEKLPILNITDYIIFFFLFIPQNSELHSSHNEPRKLSISSPKQLPYWHTLQIQYFPCFHEVQDLASFLPAMYQGHRRNLSAQHHRPVSHPVCPCKTHYEPSRKKKQMHNM